MKAWGWVLLGGLFEVGFTTALKLEQSDPGWGLVFLACAIASFECLARAIRTLPIGIAYAVWTGIGSVGAFVVGIGFFGDPRDPLRIVLVTALVACLVALRLVAGGEPATRPAPGRRPAGR